MNVKLKLMSSILGVFDLLYTIVDLLVANGNQDQVLLLIEVLSLIFAFHFGPTN